MIHSKTLKKKIIIIVSLLSVISSTGCANIKFIEKVPQSSEQNIESNTSDNLTIPNTAEDDDIEAWRTQTMSETSLSKKETLTTSKDYDLELPIITTTSYHSQIEDNETSIISSKSETNNNVSEEDFSENDEYYKYIEPVDIVFVKKTSLYKNSRDLEPFTVQSGQNALLIGHTIDSKWDIIKFSGNKFLIMASESNYVEADEAEENPTERTTVPAESERVTMTTETSALITSPTTSITTQKETTTTTTTTTTVITTQETTVTTTQQYISSVVTTTPQQITETTTTTVSSNGIHTTGNKGGIPFPDDTSKTSKVFGITFVNMEEMVVLVNDVYVSSGPGEPNDYNGYINLGIIEAGTELKCLGMSYDGWLRLRLPNNKIGFVQDVNAILANNF